MARPVHVLECAFGSDPDAGISNQVWTDISAYLDVQAGVSISRGRPDELSTIQPSTMGLTLKNVDGRFTMGNGASPYAPNVVPGKKIRYGVMWPGGGKNLAPNVETDATAAAGWTAGGGVPPALAASSAVAPPTGTHALAITWGAGTGSATLTVEGLIVGRQYTLQVNMRAQSGVQFTLTIAGTTASTTVLTTWQAKTITFTATAVRHTLTATPNTVPAAGNVALVNALQIEAGGSATSFVATAGTFAWRFTGDVNEWPLGWGGGPGLFAETSLTASDALAKLGDLGEFQTLLAESALHLSPVAFYPLGEAAGSTTAADLSANAQPALSIVQVGAGGSITFGSNVYTVSGQDTPAQPPFYMEGGAGAWISPASAGNGKFLKATLNAPTTGPGASIVAFPNGGGSLVGAGLFTVAALQAADGSYFALEMDSASVNLNGVFYNAATGIKSTALVGPGFLAGMPLSAATLTDLGTGNWRIDTYLNGVLQNSTTFAVTRAMPAWATVSVGGRTKDPGPVVLSNVQFYDYAVAAADLAVQSYAGQLGQTGATESTVDRLTVLKAFAGLDSMFVLGTGTPKNAGPGEIAGSPMAALQKVADTEAGLFMIRTDGFPTFHLAGYRYNVAATLTIAADKVDPNSIKFRGDNFGVVNDVTVTGSTGLVGRALNVASRAAYGKRKGSLDTLGSDVASLTSSAAHLAYGFGTARNRVTGLKVSLLNQPALIAAALGLDIGEKITVTSLPSQAPAASLDLFVEGYSETISEDDWSLTLNTSPADPWNVWQLGVAGHSELGSTTVLAY